MNITLILASIFSPSELAIIITIAAVAALLIAGNIALYYLLRRHQERKLCTTRLQAKRNALLEHLKNISDDGSVISGGTIYSDVAAVLEEDSEDAEADVEEDEEEDDENESAVIKEEFLDDEDLSKNEILAVADMSEYTRQKLGFVGDEYDSKRYYVRYKYGFEAKLRASSDEVKERYAELVKELMSYKGVKIASSFKGQRVYKGRKTIGLIVMRGKTVCVAFALDPKDYVGTKYNGIDVSDKKRFEKTPMMYKLTSMRRVEYAKFLIMRLAEINMILPDESAVPESIDLSMRTPDELFVAQSLHITILGEAPELEVEDEPEITLDDHSGVAASSVEDSADDESDELDELGIETPEGRIVFDRSFTARFIQSNDAFKARYSELKNYLLSFKGVRCRTSWKRETYSVGRKTLATFVIRGKTLMLYLATDPSKFDNTKYHVENMSEVASRRNTPLLFRIKSYRRTTYAKQLISMVFEENNIPHIDRKPQDYMVQYRSTDDLVKRGLIKLTTQRGFNFNSEDK